MSPRLERVNTIGQMEHFAPPENTTQHKVVFPEVMRAGAKLGDTRLEPNILGCERLFPPFKAKHGATIVEVT